MAASAQERDEAMSSIDALGSTAPAMADSDSDAEARLDAAGELIADDPGRAEAEIEGCRAWFTAHGPVVLQHRATYLLAQALVAQGRLEEAIPLIDTARDGFEACGERVLALRTNLGRSHALFELRRLAEAIAAAEALIAGFDALASEGIDVPDSRRLLAKAHQNIGLYSFDAGRSRDALASFDRATALIVGLDDDEIRGAIVLNRARALMSLGRVSEAAVDLEPWATSLPSSGLHCSL